MTVKADKVIDCKGLSCPMPVLKTKMAIDKMGAGQILEMSATDPGSINDMEAWSKKTGNAIVGTNHAKDVYVFYIKKSE